MSVTMTNEQVARLNKMFTGIYYRKKDIIPREYDMSDIISEFWVVAMTCINEKGSIEESLIATKCYSKIVDLVRESCRKSLFTMDTSILDRMGNNESDDVDYGSAFIQDDARETVSEIIVKDMLSKFKKDSSEYRFLEFMIKYYTNIQIDGQTYEGDKITAIDAYLADMLGFASGSSGGYRKVRNKVRSMVRLYRLGVDMSMVYNLEEFGFRCYDEVLGWKKDKLMGQNVELEVVLNDCPNWKYALTVNHEKVADFDTVDELKVILEAIKRVEA